MKMGEYDFGGALKGFIIGPFESVAFGRWPGQAAHFGNKMRDVFIGNVKGLICQELIDSQQEIQDGAKPGKPGSWRTNRSSSSVELTRPWTRS